MIKWDKTVTKGFDVTDFFNDGHTSEEFEELMSNSVELEHFSSHKYHKGHNTEGMFSDILAFKPEIDASLLTETLSSYLEAVTGTTDAPDEFLLGSLLPYWAGVIANKVQMTIGGMNLRPNIWLVCFAVSSEVRKSTALDIAGLPFEMVQCRLDEEYASEESEYETYLANWNGLSSKEKKRTQKPFKPNRKTLLMPSDFSDAGYFVMMKNNPISGVIVTHEFADLLFKLHRRFTDQAHAFLAAYDNKRMMRSTRLNKFETISEPSFSILGATTFAGYKLILTSTETENGFLSRIFPIVVSSPTKPRMLLLDRGSVDHNFSAQMEDQISNWLEFGGNFIVSIHPDYVEEFRRWEKSFAEESKGIYGESMIPTIERMVTGCLKVAMILQSLEIRDPSVVDQIVLQPETLKCAQMFMEAVFLPSMSVLYENEIVMTENRRNEVKIHSILSTAPEHSLERTKLRKRSGLRPKMFDKIIESMIYSGQIEESIEKVKRSQGGGRNKTVYTLID